MARGNSEFGNLKLFFMKITGLKDGEKATIKQTEVVGQKEYRELDETIQYVSGELVKVESREYEPRAGEKALELKVWLKDEPAGELYIVSVGMNSIGRSILNSILGIQPPYGVLKLSVSNNKKSGRGQVWVEHNGEQAKWKYDWETQKKYIVENSVRKNGQTVVENDYYDLNQFLIKELKAIEGNFSKAPSGELTSDIKPSSEPLAPEGVDETDDLPF